MNVGEYVRTKDGIIQKITDVFNTSMKIATDRGQRIYHYIDIVKSSPQIIDLIEVGDYVNGMPVLHIENNELICGLLLKYKEKNINSIVTKEQFKSMEYEVK